MFTNFNMNFNATFVMTHFLKLYYNVFILKNKIDALVLYQFVFYYDGNYVSLCQSRRISF